MQAQWQFCCLMTLQNCLGQGSNEQILVSHISHWMQTIQVRNLLQNGFLQVRQFLKGLVAIGSLLTALLATKQDLHQKEVRAKDQFPLQQISLNFRNVPLPWYCMTLVHALVLSYFIVRWYKNSIFCKMHVKGNI